jgi:hypothetical protein
MTIEAEAQIIDSGYRRSYLQLKSLGEVRSDKSSIVSVLKESIICPSQVAKFMSTKLYTIPSNAIISRQSIVSDHIFKVEQSPTFFDSKKSPIHRWYGIVPGFSHASVVQSFLENGVAINEVFQSY